MPLKFNPFTGTLDYTFTASEGTITTAKKPLNVVAKEIELEEGQLTNAFIKAAAGIEESKLSLPEVVIKTTNQTVTGEKNFETVQPVEVSTANGTASTKPVNVRSGKGGNTSITTTGQGGTSGSVNIATGTGGEAAAALTKSKGGNTGEIKLETGPAQEAKSAATNEGGNSGAMSLQVGGGGLAKGESATANKGGSSGSFKVVVSAGGAGQSSLAKNDGGTGGAVEFTAGSGGAANAGTKATGGNGGSVVFKAGNGGTASAGSETNTNGKGGNIRLIAGTSFTAANAGSIEFQTKEVQRFFISGEGNHAVSVETPTEFAAKTDNLAAPGRISRVSASAEVELTGIVGKESGRVLTLANVGTKTIKLMNEAAASEAENQFILPEAEVKLESKKAVELFWDGTTKKWRLIGKV